MKKYQIFILALVFVGTLLSSFHYHADINEHDDCQVCVLQNNLVSADLSSSIELDKVALYFETSAYSTSLDTSPVHKNFNSRAPPSFS